jgi:hypothetical protein
VQAEELPGCVNNGSVSRSKYLESVLQRYKEVIGLLAKAFCQDFSGIL